MSGANTLPTTGRPTRTQEVEARHWIERQLKWERTLGTLRGHLSDRRTAAAA